VETFADNLRFNLDLFPEDGLSRDFAIAPSDFAPYLAGEARASGAPEAEIPELVTSLRGRLDLRLSGRRLIVKGVFAVKVRMTCARCLADFVGRLGDRIDEVLEIGDPSMLGDADDPECFISVKDQEIDLSPLLAELFWLSWPLKALCDPGCKGLCQNCGANLNEGPCQCGGVAETRH
jgi:uncharacterized protein